jgi:crotonobetainyl-CoA:carnitine CoA-transferase CaiB-like acyl-CoA transferase
MQTRLEVVAVVTNIPGPLAAAALLRDGARVVKVEPPHGDALAAAAPAWYAAIAQGMDVRRLDFRASRAREELDQLLSAADVLITAMRGSALSRLGLQWPDVHGRYPRLCHVAIVGDAAPNDDLAGHDLTYQARAGLIEPPAMPRSVFADVFAAERAVAATYRALYERERTQQGSRVEIAIANGAAQLAEALRYGLTTPDGPLGGALALYRLYATADGWIALAALEPHFQARLQDALHLTSLDAAALGARFAEEPSAYWERVAQQCDLPLCAVAKACE